VPWYVAGLGGALIELSVSRPGMTLGDCLAAAIDRVAGSHRDTCDLSHQRTPQATVVAVRWDADSVEHLVLSDSVLLLAAPDGALTTVLDDRLGRLPDPLPALRARSRALPRGSAEHARAAAEYSRAVEALRNADGGFFTAAADPSVAARAVTGTAPRDDVHSLAALTDGAARLVQGFGEQDWASTFTLLSEQGPAELIRRVRAAETADPHGARFPRWKAHDDATAIHAEL
jgi:hypothetical protein